MIMDKEYRVENATKDGKEGCWVYWGKEDKVWWEPKPWHTKKLKEIGPAYYDTWTQPDLPFPWNDSLEERRKYSADQVMLRGLYGLLSKGLGIPSFTDSWISCLVSPKGKCRRKDANEWAVSKVYTTYGGKYPEEEGKLVSMYSYVMAYPEDVAGMSGINWTYSGKKEDEIWFYLPSVRKVRRMSAGSRQDFFPGAVNRNEDVYLTKPIHKYKILRTELLKDQSAELYDYGKGMPGYDLIVKKTGLLDHIGTPCWVVEVTLPADWWCAKQIQWLDMKTTSLSVDRSYDEKGRLIRLQSHQLGAPENIKEPWYIMWQGCPVIDLTTGYKGNLIWKNSYLGEEIPEEGFAESFCLKEVSRLFWWK